MTKVRSASLLCDCIAESCRCRSSKILKNASNSKLSKPPHLPPTTSPPAERFLGWGHFFSTAGKPFAQCDLFGAFCARGSSARHQFAFGEPEALGFFRIEGAFRHQKVFARLISKFEGDEQVSSKHFIFSDFEPLSLILCLPPLGVRLRNRRGPPKWISSGEMI